MPNLNHRQVQIELVAPVMDHILSDTGRALRRVGRWRTPLFASAAHKAKQTVAPHARASALQVRIF